ncbi:MAG: B12-binding domain-containing radical SAM protein [Magnetococcales bacterium]|nr:B12-binding domain-containing radical SAM protein [Magnetococcales bacterium]
MGQNVLLIQPMHEKKEHKKERTSINFPWGLAYVADALQRAGHRVQILDGQALQLEKQELAPLIERYDADIIGITAFSTQFNAVRFLSEKIKAARNVPIIIGGPMATYQAQFTLEKTLADVCVIGDGEITAVDLLAHWNDKSRVEGIVYKENGAIHHTPKRMVLPVMDDLPMPDFSLFDMDRYLRQTNTYSGRKSQEIRAMAVPTSRGCPYSCHFCSLSSKSYRRMSPPKVRDLLAELKNNFGVQEIIFQDELFLTSKKSFKMLAPVLKDSGISWGAQGRVNTIDEEFLAMIRDAGCQGIGYGVESGSQKILTNMNKKITVEQIERTLRITQTSGVPMKIQLMFAYPGEDEQTVAETIDLMRRVDLPGRRMTVTIPIPGAPLYDDCLAQGLIPDEAEFLVGLEKSFGMGKVHINFTQWPDDEIYPRKAAAEEAMRMNYVNNNWRRKVKYFFTRRL